MTTVEVVPKEERAAVRFGICLLLIMGMFPLIIWIVPIAERHSLAALILTVTAIDSIAILLGIIIGKASVEMDQNRRTKAHGSRR